MTTINSFNNILLYVIIVLIIQKMYGPNYSFNKIQFYINILGFTRKTYDRNYLYMTGAATRTISSVVSNNIICGIMGRRDREGQESVVQPDLNSPQKRGRNPH